ncbi:hypothetical protein DL96DRAFT_941240 [Flagelloscypha sp. PMI_526]|nr:hypothetical protein DL96DRAFT_941240 [Flagelloscypha sp. PMI_526]
MVIFFLSVSNYCFLQLLRETALLPAVSFLLAVILFQAGHELSMFFVLITSKLHVIGFLRSLNARRFLRNQVQSEKLGRISLSGSLPWIDQHVEGGLQSATGQASEEIPIHILSRDDGAAEKIIASGSQDQLQEVCLRRVTLRDTEKEG